MEESDDIGTEVMLYVIGLPKLETKITYLDYIKSLKKNINNAKEFIKKHESLEKILDSAKTITNGVIKKMGEQAELFLQCKKAYYGMINELVEVTKKDFNNKEYYYFIFQNIFKKVEKTAYEPEEAEKISPEIASIYM